MSSITNDVIDAAAQNEDLTVSEAELAAADDLMISELEVVLSTHSSRHLVVSINQPITLSKLSCTFYLQNGEVVDDALITKPEALDTNHEQRQLYDLADRLFGLDGVSADGMKLSDYEVHLSCGVAFDTEVVASMVIRVLAEHVGIDLDNTYVRVSFGGTGVGVSYSKFLKSAGTDPVRKLSKKRQFQFEEILLQLGRTSKGKGRGEALSRSIFETLAGNGSFGLGI